VSSRAAVDGVGFVVALAERFLAHFDLDRRERLGADATLEARLDESLRAARAAWPGVVVRDDEFLAWIAARLPDSDDPLTSLRTSDLYLTCACARGDSAALRAVEAGPMREVAAAVARGSLRGVAIDDVMQTIRRVLFVATDSAPPRIAEYRGTGDLRAWLRVTAVRAALKLLRKERHEVPVDDEMLSSLPAAADAELEFVKRQYRAGFKRAFLESLASLPPREQNLLRQHFLDDLSIDQLGALHRVHRSTVARWITRAQSTLFERTKRVLMKQMKVSRSECESIIRLAQSQLHVTLRTLVASTASRRLATAVSGVHFSCDIRKLPGSCRLIPDGSR
jgi:RNA polymerase sigma-70 factor, ECF subfamily